LQPSAFYLLWLLLQSAKSGSAARIAGIIPLTPQTIRKAGHRHPSCRLEGAPYEKQPPGAAEMLDEEGKI
jgi:hypothetical protein